MKKQGDFKRVIHPTFLLMSARPRPQAGAHRRGGMHKQQRGQQHRQRRKYGAP
jgi:hypothetical protein